MPATTFVNTAWGNSPPVGYQTQKRLVSELAGMKWLFQIFRKAKPPAHLRAGAWGEDVAIRHLKKNGYALIGRNVRFGPRQELDAVMQEKASGTLVFVEVKTRRSESFGRPVASVDAAKRRTLGRAAWSYLKGMKIKPARFRFDVVEVVGSPEADAAPVVRHLQNVFTLPRGMRVPW